MSGYSDGSHDQQNCRENREVNAIFSWGHFWTPVNSERDHRGGWLKDSNKGLAFCAPLQVSRVDECRLAVADGFVGGALEGIAPSCVKDITDFKLSDALFSLRGQDFPKPVPHGSETYIRSEELSAGGVTCDCLQRVNRL